MKKIFALLLITTFALTLVSCKSDFKSANDESYYVHNSGGYTLFVPEDWTVNLASSAVSASHSDGTAVTVAPFSYGSTEYMSVDLGWQEIKSNFETFFAGNYSIINEENKDDELLVDGINSGRYTYVGTIAGVKMKYMCVLTIYDTTFYNITFSSSEENFDSHTEEFEKILEHFTFGKSDKSVEGFKSALAPEKTNIVANKFTLSVDRDWITDVSTGVVSARYANGFPSSITVMQTTMGEFSNAEDYWRSYIDTFKTSLKSFTLIDSECEYGFLIDGKTACSFVFTAIPAVDADDKDTPYKYCQVLVEDGNDLYIITYASSDNTETGSGYYDVHYETFTDVLNNFKIGE